MRSLQSLDVSAALHRYIRALHAYADAFGETSRLQAGGPSNRQLQSAEDAKIVLLAARRVYHEMRRA